MHPGAAGDVAGTSVLYSTRIPGEMPLPPLLLPDLNLSCHTSWGTAEKPGQMFQFPHIHSFDCIRPDRISPLALPRGNVK